jgi:taurine dioxygenase
MAEPAAQQLRNEREYNRFQLKPIAGAMGAEIRGIDVKQLDDATFDDLYAAWLQYQVLAIRDQDITPSDQVAFASRFGEIQRHAFNKPLDGHPEITEILKTEDQKLNTGSVWHTDQHYRAEPAKMTMLHALEMPPVGGDTCFANTYLGYESLSEGLKKVAATLKGVNDGDSKNHYTGLTRMERMKAGIATMEQMKKLEGEVTVSEHPIVRTHPETGRKALYVGNHTQHFAGWTEQESKPLLDVFKQQNTQLTNTVRVRWEVGTITMWDNRCCLHSALNDYQGYRRRVHKILVKGDKPF